MNIEFVLRGNTALLCHNPQMVDQDFEVSREIRAITGKKKKTEADRQEISRLEWMGGLYTANINGKMVVSQPSSKVRKCLINAARVTKQGKQIERAIIMTQLDVPLVYDGHDKVKNIDDELARLYSNRAFVSTLSVGVNGKRVMRTRPQFLPWALVVPAIFVPDAGLNFDDLTRILELAGLAEGIGDNRVNGYGKFSGVVREIGNSPTAPERSAINAVIEKLLVA